MDADFPTRKPSSMTDRYVDEYLDIFGDDALSGIGSGDFVLEIGPGKLPRFARYIEEKTGALVALVGPHFMHERYRKNLSGVDGVRIVESRVYAVGAYAEALPFADGNFKKIFALGSIPFYCEGDDEIEKTFAELMRVLAPGGVAYIYPLDILWTQRTPDEIRRWFLNVYGSQIQLLPARRPKTLIFKKL
jgi:ubiquinone/menaquinone biosynthesis C-methylase UbiE